MQYLFKNHLKYILQLDSPHFMQIIQAVQEGLHQEGLFFLFQIRRKPTTKNGMGKQETYSNSAVR